MTTPNLNAATLSPIDHAALGNIDPAPVKIALLYGSLRARSYSRLLSEEAVRILEALGQNVACLILRVCLCRMTGQMPAIQRLLNCATLLAGQKRWSGARPNGTVP